MQNVTAFRRYDVRPRSRWFLTQHRRVRLRVSGKQKLIRFIGFRDGASAAKFYLPPKNRLNELNMRPGNVRAFGAPFGACCANGH